MFFTYNDLVLIVSKENEQTIFSALPAAAAAVVVIVVFSFAYEYMMLCEEKKTRSKKKILLEETERQTEEDLEECLDCVPNILNHLQIFHFIKQSAQYQEYIIFIFS